MVIYPGDAIRFGASTRLYILEGPEEFERGESKIGMPHRCVGGAPSPQPTSDSGCSWGMADDIPPTEEERKDNYGLPPLPSIDSFFFSSSEKYKIPNNLRQLHSQHNTKMHKLQSIQTESQRIIQKENMGVELTDGQRSQLAKNQERIVALEKDVAALKDNIEDGMFSVIYGKERGSRRLNEVDNYNSKDEDVDDFFDRTASPSKRQRRETSIVETEASLIQKWKSLLCVHAKQKLLPIRALERCTRLQGLIENCTEDSEDIFFLRNDLSIANEDLSKVKTALTETEKELDECEYLLKTVNDKLVCDRKEGLIGVNTPTSSKKPDVKQLSIENEQNTDVSADDSIMMPPPPPPPPLSVTASTCAMPPLSKPREGDELQKKRSE